MDSITFDNIAPNDYRKDFLSMKHNKTDGSYTLSYTREDGSAVEENLGYYTNGGSLESCNHLEITNDSTVVKFSSFPNY